MKDLLLLYSHCIVVKGAGRSVICDLQRSQVHLIPNSLADLFTDDRYFDIQDIERQLDSEQKDILNEYIRFIETNELAFYCSADELQHFPALSKQWLFPAHITNCILDANDTISYFNGHFLDQLDMLSCNYIQFRFYGSVTIDYLNHIMDLINISQIRSVAFLLPALQQEGVTEFVNSNTKISQFVMYGTAENKILQSGRKGMGVILQVKDSIISHLNCGVINSAFFSINIPTYTESLNHNSCLNRKIAIDVEGNIKNCPSMKDHYGNIKDTTLEEAYNKPGFKKFWNIKKDDITKCKDCEFRYICTDCRAYIEDPENLHSAPLKCGYDPYSCEWEDWSADPQKKMTFMNYELVKSNT
jgi:SPASM domain peptide maturase of grasp-with-spasm system